MKTSRFASCRLKRLFLIGLFLPICRASACTISEDMTTSLPLNSIEVPNAERVKIAEMVIAARKWPDVQIRGVIYTGGYVHERDPAKLASERGDVLQTYLIQLGIKQENIWVDRRIIKVPDTDWRGNKSLNQISITLAPICDGGCSRLCNDPRVTPNSRLVQ